MAKILLSNSTIAKTIDEFAKDMKCQVFKKLQASLCSIQCGETTNIVQILQLLVYVSFNRRGYAVLQTPREYM